MNCFWEDINGEDPGASEKNIDVLEQNLDMLEKTLDEDIKYEGSEGVQMKFEAKKAEREKTDDKITVRGRKENAVKKVRKKRKLYLVLAAVLVMLCGVGAVASNGTWYLTEPDTFKGEVTKIEETMSYTWNEEEQAYVDAANEPLSDEYFLEQTREILKLIGDENVDMSRMKVIYQKDEWWNREEAEVSFPLKGGDGWTSAVFDRETGYFLSMDCFGNEEGEGPVMSDEEALETARSWYEKLPYPQGYEFTNVHKVCDDWGWMYSFSRKVDVEIDGEPVHLINAYEEARISINPITGALESCNVFYVPLLDDHKEGDVPLTEEEAVEIAANKLKKQMNAEFSQAQIHASIEIVHPNYTFTAYGWHYPWVGETEEETESAEDTEETENLRMSAVTRLAWDVVFEFPVDEGFVNEVRVYVDLYTGEVLGGDEAK